MDLYNTSMGEEEPDTIELTHEQYEEAKAHFDDIITKGDAARRLAKDEGFELLILQGYLFDEPARLAELLSSGRLNNKVAEDTAEAIKAVGIFRNYMKNIIEQSNIAKDELAGLEEARDIAIKEAAGE